jgi:hypothetical protein
MKPKHKPKHTPEPKQVPKEVKAFLLTRDELKKIKGTHGFGSWKMACAGCGREFTEADIGSTVVSIRTKRHPFPKEYYHLKCFNEVR